MRFSTMLCALVVLAGCGGDALVEEAREAGYYNCPEGACTTAGGEAGGWVEHARGVMGAISDDVLACNDGEPFTLRLRVDGDGAPQGLGAEPALGSDQRVCVGRLVYDHVHLQPYEGGDRVVAYAYGGESAPTYDEAAPSDEPSEPAPAVVDDPSEPEPTDAPAEGDAGDGGEEAPPEGDEGTDVPDDLVE